MRTLAVMDWAVPDVSMYVGSSVSHTKTGGVRSDSARTTANIVKANNNPAMASAMNALRFILLPVRPDLAVV